MMQYFKSAGRSNFKNRTKPKAASRVGNSVKGAVFAHHQATIVTASIGSAIEMAKHCKNSGRSYFKYRAYAVGTASRGKSIQVSIFSLYQVTTRIGAICCET